MDLIERIRRWVWARPRVLLIDAPGAGLLRWTTEAELDRRHWTLASSPAETDLLVVLGTPGPELGRAVDVIWSQVPAPRHRTSVEHGVDVGPALDAALEALRDSAGRPQPDELTRPDPTSLLGPSDETGSTEGMEPTGTGHEAMDHGPHGGMDHSGHEGMGHSGHAGTDHSGDGGMEHSGHAGMDHSDHGGMDVAGLPMADTAPDRDGLQLDELRISLGPVLKGWPTGLVLSGRLQGDVLSGVTLRWADADEPGMQPPPDSGDIRLLALDQLARFLDVAGWPTAARDARRARDHLSADGVAAAGHRLAVRTARRVGHSRTLAWSVRGIGVLGDADARALHGDVLDRIRRWGRLAADPEATADAIPELPLERLAELLEGTELAAARLTLASLPMTRRAAEDRAGTAHG